MKNILSGMLSIVCCLASTSLFAVTIYECEDEQGNRTFEQKCPPGTNPVQEKKVFTGKKEGSAPAAVNVNATLYSVPECDACQEIREFLTFRNISFTDKNVGDNIELQNELREVAGELKVPVLVIGEKIIKGYNRSEILDALKTAGYTEPESDQPAAGSKAETTEEPAAAEGETAPAETEPATSEPEV